MTVDVVCLGETMALVAPDPPLPLTVARRLVPGQAEAGPLGQAATAVAARSVLDEPGGLVVKDRPRPAIGFHHRRQTEMAALPVALARQSSPWPPTHDVEL